MGISTFIQGSNSDLLHCRWILYQLSVFTPGSLPDDEAQRRKMSFLGAHRRARRFQPGSLCLQQERSSIAPSCPHWGLPCVCGVCTSSTWDGPIHTEVLGTARTAFPGSVCVGTTQGNSVLMLQGLPICWHVVRIRKGGVLASRIFFISPNRCCGDSYSSGHDATWNVAQRKEETPPLALGVWKWVSKYRDSGRGGGQVLVASVTIKTG